MAAPTDRNALVAGFTRADVAEIAELLGDLSARNERLQADQPSMPGTRTYIWQTESAALADALELLRHIAANG